MACGCKDNVNSNSSGSGNPSNNTNSSVTYSDVDVSEIKDYGKVEFPINTQKTKIYKITNTYTGRTLDASEFGYTDGAEVRNARYTGDMNQLWAIASDGDKVIIYNLTTGYVLSVSEGSKSDGAQIIVEEFIDDADAQRWTFKETDNGVEICSALSGKPIGIVNDDRTDKAPITLNSGTAEKSKAWKIESVNINVKTLPHLLKLSGSVVHSSTPEVVRYGDKYYSYNMSPGIGIKVSDNLKSWKYIDQVTAYPQSPLLPFDWMEKAVPGGSIWAPGVYKIGDLYYMYYCISTGGSQVSAIGVGVNKTLDSSSPDFAWKDLGMVISSKVGDPYNCIDPNIMIDDNGKPWLIFGSWWKGIFARRIDEKTGKLSEEDKTFYPLASQESKNSGIEAPYMIKRGEYYYLFAAFGNTQENYHSEVGRSKSITGPFLDKDGVDMLNGGGTLVTYGNEYFGGPGHASIFIDKDGQHYMVSETFNNNKVIMMITTLEFDNDGWPVTALTKGIAK